jgi:AcrR family transcriptional regulator
MRPNREVDAPEQASESTPRWAGQRERRRAEFVDAALVVIDQYGPQTSTEQIAAHVGVTRTKLYRHFEDAADLQRAVALRVSEMLTAKLEPVFKPQGSMAQIIEAGIRAHVEFLIEHQNLYRYLVRCSVGEPVDAPGAVPDIKVTIGTLLAQVYDVYVRAFGMDADTDIMSFAVVGLVEAATGRWLEQPEQTSQDRLVEELGRWIWLMLDDALRTGGVYLDADEPLPDPAEIAASADLYRDPGRHSGLI